MLRFHEVFKTRSVSLSVNLIFLESLIKFFILYHKGSELESVYFTVASEQQAMLKV